MKGKERRVDFSGVGCAVRLADTVLIASTLTVAARVPNARPASRTATRYDGSIDRSNRFVDGHLDPWRNGGNNGDVVTVLEGESVWLLIGESWARGFRNDRMKVTKVGYDECIG